ncbi:MAG: DUF4916 domain-containing protein [Actinomycetaceae bacterium]|nr:DUF4916 domain-containing protein [Actinomycetaceae bacterium]
MSDVASGDMGPWLSPDDLDFIRRKTPILYVDIIPVRLGQSGQLEAIGLLLSAKNDGIIRSIVSGRVLYHESIRDAIARHIEKDLGQMAIPQIPAHLAPFTVCEYFPTPGEGQHDPRQHAVSLAYIVPMVGDCEPSSDALEVSWFTPGEMNTASLQAEIDAKHRPLIR